MAAARRSTGLALAALATVLTAAPAVAASVGARCAYFKQRAGGKKASDKLNCHAKAVVKGAVVDPACLTKAEGKFAAAFQKAEMSGGCTTPGDAAAIEAAVDTFVSDMLAALPDGGTHDGRVCAAKKQRETGKKAFAKLKCHAKAAHAGSAPDPLCLSKAEARFSTAFAKAEGGGGCATTGDAAAIEATVDAFVGALVAALPPSPPVFFAADVEPIFAAHCAVPGCHVAPTPPAFLNLEVGQAWTNLVGIASNECGAFDRVMPGDPDASYLVFKLEGAGPCFMGVQMPFLQPPLLPVEIELIRNWILQGAPDN
jgi:hypothetical protein